MQIAANANSPAAGDAPVFSSAARLPELDGIRGLAILLVLLCHYGGQQVHPAPGTVFNLLAVVMNFGWIGVDLFFVLSGFLIGGILIDNRSSPRFFQTFYIRRLCRIFPLYYAWLGITLILLAAGLPWRLQRLVQPDIPFWSYFTYTQNIFLLDLGEFGNPWFGVTWSLAVEEQFYLLFPLLVRYCRPAALPLYLLGLIAAAGILRGLAFSFLPAPGLAGYVLLPCRWDSLFLGVLTAWMIRQPGFAERVGRYEKAGLVVGGVIIAVIVGLRIAHQGDLRSPGMHLFGFPLLAVFFCGLLVLTLYSRLSWLPVLFRNPLLCRLGIVSYGVYLLHQPVSWLIHAMMWRAEPRMDSLPTAMTTLLALATTLTLAALSWRYFEARWLVWGRRFAY